jgi:hypothetical protein
LAIAKIVGNDPGLPFEDVAMSDLFDAGKETILVTGAAQGFTHSHLNQCDRPSSNPLATHARDLE